MRAFEYNRPSSLEEAGRLLQAPDVGSHILAGGTDLLVRIKRGEIIPQKVISLRDVPGLSFVRTLPDGGVTIGAMTPLSALEISEVLLKRYSALAEAAAKIGSAQVRSRATVGGNLCNAAPSADMAPILIAYGAGARVSNGRDERSTPLEDFFKGPGQTDLKRGEILKEIHLPAARQPCFAVYLKACRSRMDIALVGVGLRVLFEPNGEKCREVSLVLGAVGPVPIRVRSVEQEIAGSPLDDRVIERVSQLAREAASPISDIRASAGYRLSLVEALTHKALTAARLWVREGGAH